MKRVSFIICVIILIIVVFIVIIIIIETGTGSPDKLDCKCRSLYELRVSLTRSSSGQGSPPLTVMRNVERILHGAIGQLLHLRHPVLFLSTPATVSHHHASASNTRRLVLGIKFVSMQDPLHTCRHKDAKKTISFRQYSGCFKHSQTQAHEDSFFLVKCWVACWTP